MCITLLQWFCRHFYLGRYLCLIGLFWQFSWLLSDAASFGSSFFSFWAFSPLKILWQAITTKKLLLKTLLLELLRVWVMLFITYMKLRMEIIFLYPGIVAGVCFWNSLLRSLQMLKTKSATLFNLGDKGSNFTWLETQLFWFIPGMKTRAGKACHFLFKKRLGLAKGLPGEA